MSTWNERQTRKDWQRNLNQSEQDAYKKKMMMWGVVAIVAGFAVIGGYKYFSKPSIIIDPKQTLGNDWKRGAIAPQVTLLEYGDFQCPACKAYGPLVKRILDTFPTQLGLVFRHYPLTQIHQNATSSAAAAQAAGLQGKFFEMHDLLYEHQEEWSPLPSPHDTFESYAKQLNLNTDQWNMDMKSSMVSDAIKAQKKTGDQLKVQGTPTFFINGVIVPQNPKSFEEFKALIQQAIDKAPSFALRATEGKPFHAHANFLVMANGKALDFSKQEYQSTETKELNDDEHLHNSRGGIMHTHKENQTWQEFFKSLGMELTDQCFSESAKQKYCSGGGKTLSLILNGTTLTQWENMPINDLDRLLINYGSQTASQLQEAFKKVPDDACIFSEKCPQRGKPPEKEPCVGGLGTKCD